MPPVVSSVLFYVTWALEFVSAAIRMALVIAIAMLLGLPHVVILGAAVAAGGAPLLLAFITRDGLAGGAAHRWRLGARRPSPREAQHVEAALAKLAGRGSAVPSHWYVIDSPSLDASTLGDTLFVCRDLIYSDYLEPVLAHECGHLDSGAAQLLLALHRFALPGAHALRSWLVRKGHPALAGLVLAVFGGWGLSLVGVAAAWRWLFRQSEFTADEIAAKLGYSDQLIQYLDTYALPYDVASPFMAGRTHPYTEERIARLLEAA